MGSNIIYLADLAVPSYRRLRAVRTCPTGTVLPLAPARAAPGIPADGGWAAAARRRAAPPSAQLSLEQPQHPGEVEPAAQVRVSPPGPDALHNRGARLRISGRLIDVCAELERLAAAEAAQSAADALRA